MLMMDSLCKSPSPVSVMIDDQEEPYPLGIPEQLVRVLPLVTKSQKELMISLCSSECNQAHLFEHWPNSEEVDISPAFKRRIIEQLEKIDKAYPSGLVGYIKTAKDLLDKSRKGVNSLEGWKPAVPKGEVFEVGTEDYNDVEKLGMRELHSVGFVLVAEGLGERVGYDDTKLALPTEMATGTTYLQIYIESILAIQKKYGKAKLPLCIMTSAETHFRVVKMLDQNNYFGMTAQQVTIVAQGEGVPAMVNNEAKIALDPNDGFRILTKVHGNGDIHALLHEHGVAKKWKTTGTEWIVFLQDNNGLAFQTLPLMLGSSVKNSLVLNWLAVPQAAERATSCIAKLVNEETKEERTMMVEYSQLDSLLRASRGKIIDVSSFPGSTGQFIFQLDSYLSNLERTKGSVPELVNPEYANEEKTEFLRPTRLECSMQDFSCVLQGRDATKVGVTTVPAELCFSPIENAIGEASPATAEIDQYDVHSTIMRSIGCHVEKSYPQTFNGIIVMPSPQIVIKPAVACFPCEYRHVFPNPSKIRISARSSLVVSGPELTIHSLDLDGALVLEGKGEVRDLVVRNVGWQFVADQESKDEMVALRGYRLEKKETETVVLGGGEGWWCRFRGFWK